MQRTRWTYAIVIGASFFLLLGAASGWLYARWQMRMIAGSGMAGMTDLQRLLPLGVLLLLWVMSALWLTRFLRHYIFQIRRLNQDARLALTANHAHRAAVEGPAVLRALGETINAYGARFQLLRAERDEEIARARADLTAERNLLATLMAELGDAVLVCNWDGTILLYNRSARRLLSQGEQDASGFVGLGRSIFGLLDRDAVNHGIEQLRAGIDRSDQLPVSFLAAMVNGRLVRVGMVETGANRSSPDQSDGFILTLQDMTQSIEASSRRDFILQRMTEQMRAALGGIRAASETLAAYPHMEPDRRRAFDRAIHDEAQKLSAELDATMQAYAQDLKAQWRLEVMPGNDLLRAVARQAERRLSIRLTAEPTDDALWLRVDSYAMVHGVMTLLQRLRDDFGIAAGTLRLQVVNAGEQSARRLAAFDLTWPVEPLGMEMWQAWSEHAYIVDSGDATLTLQEVAERHGGAVWFQADARAGIAYFRLLLPAAEPPPAPVNALEETGEYEQVISRPVYYDFDLFHQPGQQPKQDQELLTLLAYTVFDTETTGLDPARDDIINIGAVRIVNGHLLHQEAIDYLIDPGRSIPPAATAIHGITNEMVMGKPSIDVVLPRFARFVDATVLVAHNAAFDLRILQNYADTTGVRLINPVLDTLLLSAVVHPDETDHSLEAIARRLGVQVKGRHTALGDAVLTAKVFQGLMQLLIFQGITTLGAARAAAQETYFAHIAY
ncbi:MAG: DNA polymerase III subunit epsilon [Caldilineaceae bacterium]|nr:DNA polymerase III subunit epsilon [Caldilineaceae bacterium]